MSYEIETTDGKVNEIKYRIIKVAGVARNEEERTFYRDLECAYDERADKNSHILLDLTAVTGISSEPIGDIIMLNHKHIKENKESLYVLGNEKINEILKITHLNRVLKVSSSLEEFFKVINHS